MNRAFVIIVLAVSFCAPLPCLADEPPFHVNDPLAARDEYGLLHQDPSLSRTDFARRYSRRLPYYFFSGTSLIAEPAYVGALQRDLHRLGYYCGEIDGIFSLDVADAIARMQKNYSMPVTGTLTVPVRRALHLP